MSHYVYTGFVWNAAKNLWLTCCKALGLLQTWSTRSAFLQLWVLSLTTAPPPPQKTTTIFQSLCFQREAQLLIQEQCDVHIPSTSFAPQITPQSTFVFQTLLTPFPSPGRDKLPSPSIKHPSSCSSGDPWSAAGAVSHLLSCWYRSSDSLAKINQIFWKALCRLLRCVTDVRQTWLHLSRWRMVGCWAWTEASNCC